MTAQLVTTLQELALLDLGQDASQQDIDYHLSWVLSLTAAQFQDYLICLGVNS